MCLKGREIPQHPAGFDLKTGTKKKRKSERVCVYFLCASRNGDLQSPSFVVTRPFGRLTLAGDLEIAPP
jgi:hypothetical protein